MSKVSLSEDCCWNDFRDLCRKRPDCPCKCHADQKSLERIPAAAVCGFRQHDGIEERLAAVEQRVARLEAALSDDAIQDEDGQCTACWMWIADGSPHDESCLILYLRAALAGEGPGVLAAADALAEWVSAQLYEAGGDDPSLYTETRARLAAYRNARGGESRA